MRKIIAVIAVVLLLVISVFALTSCWIGDRTLKPGQGSVSSEPVSTATSSSAPSGSGSSETQPAAPADTSDDEDELDIFGD